MAKPLNPYEHVKKTLPGTDKTYFSLKDLNDPRVDSLPYSIKILLESALRNCDEFEVKKEDVENIVDWVSWSCEFLSFLFSIFRSLFLRAST